MLMFTSISPEQLCGKFNQLSPPNMELDLDTQTRLGVVAETAKCVLEIMIDFLSWRLDHCLVIQYSFKRERKKSQIHPATL